MEVPQDDAMDMGGLDDVEALKHDSLDQVSKLMSTERYQRIMQARGPAWPRSIQYSKKTLPLLGGAPTDGGLARFFAARVPHCTAALPRSPAVEPAPAGICVGDALFLAQLRHCRASPLCPLPLPAVLDPVAPFAWLRPAQQVDAGLADGAAHPQRIGPIEDDPDYKASSGPTCVLVTVTS